VRRTIDCDWTILTTITYGYIYVIVESALNFH